MIRLVVATLLGDVLRDEQLTPEQVKDEVWALMQSPRYESTFRHTAAHYTVRVEGKR